MKLKMISRSVSTLCINFILELCLWTVQDKVFRFTPHLNYLDLPQPTQCVYIVADAFLFLAKISLGLKSGYAKV